MGRYGLSTKLVDLLSGAQGLSFQQAKKTASAGGSCYLDLLRVRFTQGFSLRRKLFWLVVTPLPVEVIPLLAKVLFTQPIKAAAKRYIVHFGHGNQIHLFATSGGS